MTHEPECPVATFWIPRLAECHCDILRTAYQRGRKNAAAAIENLESNNYDMVWVRLAVTAARGDGEQE